MPTRIQFRRGTTAQHASFTGAVGEVTVDTDKEVVVVHDGSTAGGFEMARSDVSNVSNPQFSGTSTLLLPSGTTAQRDASPTNGQVRYNSSLNIVEGYQDSAWSPLGTVVQTINQTSGDYFTSTNTSTTNFPNMSLTITPKSTNNYLWFTFNWHGQMNGMVLQFQLFDGSNIVLPAELELSSRYQAYSFYQSNTSVAQHGHFNGMVPVTSTSAKTYQIRYWSHSSSTVGHGANVNTGTLYTVEADVNLTVMEIAQTSFTYVNDA